MLKERLLYVARLTALALLIGVVGLIVVSFVKRRNSLQQIPPVTRAEARLSDKVIAITEGYRYLSSESGQKKFMLTAARDTSYADGRHELEQMELISYAADGKEVGRVRADKGSYQQDKDTIIFRGHVVATDADGLEVTTEALDYNQQTRVASTDVAMNFKRAEMSGSSVGAVLYAKEKNLELRKDAHLVIAPKDKADPPLEIRGQQAQYAQNDGVVRFTGAVTVAQGPQSGRADAMTGIYNKGTNKLERVEARGNSYLKSQESGKHSEVQARDMDFYFDEAQRLKLVVAVGGAQARSLEKDAPRELRAERIEAYYKTQPQGGELTSAVTQGRTVLRIAPGEGAAGAQAEERVIEADGTQVAFQPGGKFMARAEANGNAVLTITPLAAAPQAEVKRLRAPRFTAEFFDAGNALKTFVAEGGAVAEFDPMPPQTSPHSADKPRLKRTLSGQKMAARFEPSPQEVSELNVEGDAKYVEGERHATAARALYAASARTVALRGKPQVWDAVARTSAEEIDANVDTGESFARGRVRTTYYSRETTNGAAPFKKGKSPVFVTADRAAVRHREAAARYEGNARAWQDDNFVRGDALELDNNERTMTATGGVQSALYSVERETGGGPQEKGQPERAQKEVVPVFASADRMHYFDQGRLVRYSGRVKLRQGTDQIDAATAEATMDEEYRMTSFTAQQNVVLTQPMRRGTGDRIDYTAATDTAVLTGRLAQLEDRERDVVTRGATLTLHLRDARIAATDEGGTKRVRTTHRIKR
jgi:lipopolysaccharide export system protein LptA